MNTSKIVKGLAALALIGGVALGGVACAPVDTSATSSDTTTSAPDKPAKRAAKAKAAKYTKSQEMAIKAAESYLDTMPFSKKGLIQQLSPEAGSGYPKADAKLAVNHLEKTGKVDWHEQAEKAAQSYLDTMPFSKADLIQQLESDAGSQFTHDQAVKAVDKVYA